MQKLLSLYYQCCYLDHWKELTEVINFKLSPSVSIGQLVQKCVKGAHQRRVRTKSVQNAVNNLLAAGILGKKYADFEALYQDVRTYIGGVSGIGDLTIYDTALRMGFIMDPIVLPNQYIYLACGAKIGAEALLGRKVNYREQLSMFSKYFGNLSNHFVENFLCIMKNYLDKGGIKKGVVVPPDARVCKCECAKIVRSKHAGKFQYNTSCGCHTGACGVCKRIRKKNGELKIEYLENGEQINN